MKYEVRPLNLAANRALGGRWVEVHHAANHAKFGPRTQRTTLADVLAAPGKRHEQWQCFAWDGPQAALAAGASISHRAQGGSLWPDGGGMPDHQPQALPPTNPDT